MAITKQREEREHKFTNIIQVHKEHYDETSRYFSTCFTFSTRPRLLNYHPSQSNISLLKIESHTEIVLKFLSRSDQLIGVTSFLFILCCVAFPALLLLG